MRQSLVNASTNKMTATLKNKKDLRSSQNGLPHQQAYISVDPKTPARRNQISRTSELKEFSENMKKEQGSIGLAAREMLQSDQKSNTPGPGYASVKKELRNKSKKLG